MKALACSDQSVSGSCPSWLIHGPKELAFMHRGSPSLCIGEDTIARVNRSAPHVEYLPKRTASVTHT